METNKKNNKTEEEELKERIRDLKLRIEAEEEDLKYWRKDKFARFLGLDEECKERLKKLREEYIELLERLKGLKNKEIK